MDASVPDLPSIDQALAIDDGGPSTTAAFSIIGCESFSITEIGALCIGKPPLELTFVSLLSGTTSNVWTLTGAVPSSSMQLSPTVVYDQPGTFLARLAAEGPGGTSVSTGTIVVTPGGTSSPCRTDADCDASAGLSCLCQGNTCPGGLVVGLCTKDCDAASCDSGSVCVDLDRARGPRPSGDGGVGGAAPGDGGVPATMDAWRRRLCLPTCTDDTSCRPGLACLQLATRPNGAYQRACFARVAGEVGAPCRDGAGAPDPTACFSGRCLAIGGFGQCSEDCASITCPNGSQCANVAGQSAVCVSECDSQMSCADALLSCQSENASDDLGLSSTSGKPLCAPKPCGGDGDCSPLGTCETGYCSR